MKRKNNALTSLMETRHLLSSSKNAERLLAALARARAQEKDGGTMKGKRLAAINIKALKKCELIPDISDWLANVGHSHLPFGPKTISPPLTVAKARMRAVKNRRGLP